MLKKYLRPIMVVSSLMLAAGCSEQSPSGPEKITTINPQCGTFGLSSMGKLEKRAAATTVRSGSDVKFDLGRIKGSSGFFFLLYNVGMTPITNVSLSIDNPAFSVFPSSMDTLIPGSDVGMLPVIKIAAFHGTPYDGVGTRPLLPKGPNTFVLHVSGNSKNASGADTVITLDAEMDLEALVMDLSIEGRSGLLDAIPVGGLNISELAHIGKDIKNVSQFITSCKDDTIITINNTGNVPLHCMIYRSLMVNSAYQVDKVTDSVISAGNNMSVSLDTIAESFYLVASGDNAVADPVNISLNDNGMYYAWIRMSSQNCTDTLVVKRFNEYLDVHEQDQCAKIWALLNNSVLIYGQSYNAGDSVVFLLLDLVNNEQLTSFSGTLDALVQDNCYNGIYLNDFIVIANGMLTTQGWKGRNVKLTQGEISGGGSQNWIVTNSAVLTACSSSNE
ncbi:MAG: hypothetical protein JW915_21690 [Chitinispirillaceae bacterium]|nr:hypothetical protein [Chitinispirillaceae bacterium]